MKKIPLHAQIIIALVAGLVFGLTYIFLGGSPTFTADYIKPFGTIFINGLKMIAVPLVFSSLVTGVATLGDISKLSRIGGKTIALYLSTTVIAVSLGLAIVNLLQPGKKLPGDIRDELMALYTENTKTTSDIAEQLKSQSPLQPLVDIVPENIVNAAGNNTAMLQVVFFALLLGVALLSIPRDKSQPVIGFFDGLNDAIIKIVGYIMRIAPLGVFALISSLIIDIAGNDPDRAVEILKTLLWYALTVITGLIVMTAVVYPVLLKIFTSVNYRFFFRSIRPAQLLAFSTSSSSATLPVTLKQAEEALGVSEHVRSFVLPLGATINMDGTCLYQGVASVFIAQALGLELSFVAQLTIVLTATLASIGTAGVPGAGVVMLLIVLESVGIPAAGLALIIAPDRILDMCRTVTNITGDLTVMMVVESSEKNRS